MEFDTAAPPKKRASPPLSKREIARAKQYYLEFKNSEPERLGSNSQIGEWKEKLPEILGRYGAEQREAFRLSLQQLGENADDHHELLVGFGKKLQTEIDLEMESGTGGRRFKALHSSRVRDRGLKPDGAIITHGGNWIGSPR